MKNNWLFSRIALVLLVAQVLLMLLTWVVNAAAPQLPLRPILSPEGLRWLFGCFVDNLSSPLSVWLLLLFMAYGALHNSGLLRAVRTLFSLGKLQFRQLLGLRLVAFEVVVFLLVTVLLTCIPHALLLSVTGHLFPSSFSHGLIPMLAAMLIILSLSYGAASGTIDTLDRAYESCVIGLRWLAHLLPIYVLATELLYSVVFIFRIDIGFAWL